MRAVLLLAVVALASLQVAAGGYIYMQSYATDFINTPSNFFCNGTAATVPQQLNYTSGTCYNNVPTNTSSYQLYCSGGTGVIRISYSSANCPAANVTSMGLTPSVCGAGSVSSMWKCDGTDTLPNSWTYPPANWVQSTVQYNNTLTSAFGESTPACGTVNRGVTVTSYSNPGCVNTEGSTNQSPRRSARVFAGDAAGNAFQAQYNDYNCAAANLVQLNQVWIQACKNGATTVGLTGGDAAPAKPINQATNNILASSTFYEKSGANFCGNKLRTTWFAATCFDSATTVCVNGTVYTESNYGANAGGVCTGSQILGYPKVRNSTAGNCVQQDGGGDYGYSYSCTGESPDTGAASTASFSIISLVIAAIVALLAQ